MIYEPKITSKQSHLFFGVKHLRLSKVDLRAQKYDLVLKSNDDIKYKYTSSKSFQYIPRITVCG